jgi:hypothetical protein
MIWALRRIIQNRPHEIDPLKSGIYVDDVLSFSSTYVYLSMKRTQI